jgi:hypothetical protein
MRNDPYSGMVLEMGVILSENRGSGKFCRKEAKIAKKGHRWKPLYAVVLQPRGCGQPQPVEPGGGIAGRRGASYEGFDGRINRVGMGA